MASKQDLADEQEIAKPCSGSDETSASGLALKVVVEVRSRRVRIAGQGIPGSLEVGAVEHIVRIDFQTEGNTLADLRILEDTEVDVVEGISAEDVSC